MSLILNLNGHVLRMKGTINSAWFTGNEGNLHSQIIPNLSTLVEPAAAKDFRVTFWTNTSQTKAEEISELEKKGIQVLDYSACSSSSFYPYFMYFFEQGIQGDKAAFALASDIFRMSILELTPAEHYFIYHDPNDITFPDLEQSLSQLTQLMFDNIFGFSFPIDHRSSVIEIRNDLLIAKKLVNLDFFKNFFTSYKKHLEENYRSYKTPHTTSEAQLMARTISLGTGSFFFDIISEHELHIKAKFCTSFTKLSFISCLSLFPYDRHFEFANTWLPKTGFTEALEEECRVMSSSASKSFPTFFQASSAQSVQESESSAADILCDSEQIQSGPS